MANSLVDKLKMAKGKLKIIGGAAAIALISGLAINSCNTERYSVCGNKIKEKGFLLDKVIKYQGANRIKYKQIPFSGGQVSVTINGDKYPQRIYPKVYEEGNEDYGEIKEEIARINEERREKKEENALKILNKDYKCNSSK